ncbi:MAG TPA: type III-B CRISPR module RAMP protein Cmr6 [Spirochaetota bacterium]|nr:type III-B CRISPR module RAMP protein Cmr6 [Spirochaetota bacterium]
MPVFHPFNREARNFDFSKGNYGLWYTKYIPVSCDEQNFAKASDDKGDTTNAVNYYFKRYNVTNNVLLNELSNRHVQQKEFMKAMEKNYHAIELRVKLISPLLTGVGYPHPSESSLLFEHTLGIPYIPASSIKGVVRFAFTIGLLDDDIYGTENYYGTDKDGKRFLKEELTPVKDAFGYSADNNSETNNKEIIKSSRGKVIFLDAYPEKIPGLIVDILNPHYPEYYSGNKPPADNQDPLPVKFLAVARDTVFLFRVLVKKVNDELLVLVKNAIERAFFEEGVGAKTTIGYGRFKFAEQSQDNKLGIKNNKKDEQTQEIEIIQGNKYVAQIVGITQDGGSVQVIMPNGQKTIIGKKQFPKNIQNNLKQYLKKGMELNVEVVSYQSGNIVLKLIDETIKSK